MAICFLPVSPADDVSVTFSVPGAGSDTSAAKNILANPPDNGLRQLVDYLHISRHTEVRHPGATEVQQLRVIQRGARSHRDDQQDVVLAEVAGHADGRGFEHRRMTQHNSLDFDRRNVLAAAAQRILHPVYISQVLVAVQHTEVTGPKPLRRRGDATFTVHIALAHDVRVAGPASDLPYRSVRETLAIRVDD